MISVFFVYSVYICFRDGTQGAGRHSPCRSSFAISETAMFMETKKTWESVLRAYPYSQALALPLDEDKQRRSLPTSVNIYAHATTQHNP